MPHKVLIVEDDQNFRRLVEIRLRNWEKDISITYAETLNAARTLLDQKDNKFCLVILDQHLPDGFGYTLFSHPALQDAAVLAVSADKEPELPAKTVRAGAQHFLSKNQITEPLFIPLLEALVERKQFEAEVISARIQRSKLDTIRTLVRTLQHEINNPLGGVLGGVSLLRLGTVLDSKQSEAIGLIENSGKRIKQVLDQLCDAVELQAVTKGTEQLFHVPGDPEWEKKC